MIFSTGTLEVIKGLNLFSMDNFRLNVSSHNDAITFEDEEDVNILVKVFCQDYIYQAK